MNEPGERPADPAAPADAAAAWVLRCDRGLSAREQDDFSAWLAADPRHREALARHRGHWRRLDRLAEWRPEHSTAPNPDLLAPPLRRRVAPWAWAMAAAAALAAFLFVRPTLPEPGPDVEAGAAAPEPGPSQRLLADGSMVELNRDAEIAVAFGADERRVELLRGEAMFSVQRDPQRPFVVVARGVAVRAVGTAFNVRVDAAVVEVLVTEGTVRVDPPAAGPAPDVSAAVPPPSLLQARQRAVIDLAPARRETQIATLTAGEVERVLAWQHRQLDFTAAPLAQIVAEFNRRNVVQLVVVDPGLAAERISATFRSDNIAGFVRLLEVGFGARAEQRGDTEIVLRRDERR